MDIGPDPASLFHAAFLLGFCCGVLVAAVVWYQSNMRRDP